MRMLSSACRPVIGFAAYSGAGKTTLLKNILPLLSGRGLRIAMIKHAHHAFDIDHPGKDSYELRKAGASQMLVASGQREALITEKSEFREPDLNLLIGKLDQDCVDMILVEGFKNAPFPKIEIFRASVGKPVLYPDDNNIIAVVTNGELPVSTHLPILDIDNCEEITEFIYTFSLLSR